MQKCPGFGKQFPWFSNHNILLSIYRSKMVGIRINTSSHTKEIAYMMNSQFLQKQDVKYRQQREQNTCVYVSQICAEGGGGVVFPVTKKCFKKWLKCLFISNGRQFETWFPRKTKKFHFSKENYVKLHKKAQFCITTIIFALNRRKQQP